MVTTVTDLGRKVVNKRLPVSCGTGADRVLGEIPGDGRILLEARGGLPGGGGVSAGPGSVNGTGLWAEGSSTGLRLPGAAVVFGHRVPSAVDPPFDQCWPLAHELGP